MIHLKKCCGLEIQESILIKENEGVLNPEKRTTPCMRPTTTLRPKIFFRIEKDSSKAVKIQKIKADSPVSPESDEFFGGDMLRRNQQQTPHSRELGWESSESRKSQEARELEPAEENLSKLMNQREIESIPSFQIASFLGANQPDNSSPHFSQRPITSSLKGDSISLSSLVHSLDKFQIKSKSQDSQSSKKPRKNLKIKKTKSCSFRNQKYKGPLFDLKKISLKKVECLKVFIEDRKEESSKGPIFSKSRTL